MEGKSYNDNDFFRILTYSFRLSGSVVRAYLFHSNVGYSMYRHFMTSGELAKKVSYIFLSAVYTSEAKYQNVKLIIIVKSGYK